MNQYIKEKYQSIKSGLYEIKREFLGYLFDKNYTETKKILKSELEEKSKFTGDVRCGNVLLEEIPKVTIIPYQEDKREKKTLAEHYICETLRKGKDVKIPSLNIILQGRQ